MSSDETMKPQDKIFYCYAAFSLAYLLTGLIPDLVWVVVSFPVLYAAGYYNGKDKQLKEFDDWNSYTVTTLGIKCDLCGGVPHLTATPEDKWVCDDCLRKSLNTIPTEGSA
jgi:hypothetical protein